VGEVYDDYLEAIKHEYTLVNFVSMPHATPDVHVHWFGRKWTSITSSGLRINGHHAWNCSVILCCM